MQNRYTGDIGDYVKYGLLRALAKGRRLGIAWYLFPDESNRDGRHIEYLQDPTWRDRDERLFDTLKQIVDGKRSVGAIEQSGILQGCEFSNEILSVPKAMHGSARYRERCDWRSGWFGRVQDSLAECDLVFADPDNGLYDDGKFRPGTIEHWKRIPLHEARALAAGRPAIIYHHNGRSKKHRDEVEYWLEQLGSNTLALYWGAWSNRTFFVVDPSSDMKERLERFVRDWGPKAQLIQPRSDQRRGSAMTFSQMRSRFLSEWILVGDPDTDAELNVRGGEVLYHSKDRDEIYRRATSLRPRRSAVVYTGKIPKDAAIIL